MRRNRQERRTEGTTDPENPGISLTRLAPLRADVYDDNWQSARAANLHRRDDDPIDRRADRPTCSSAGRPTNRFAVGQIDGVLLCPDRRNNDHNATSGDDTLDTAYVFVLMTLRAVFVNEVNVGGKRTTSAALQNGQLRRKMYTLSSLLIYFVCK